MYGIHIYAYVYIIHFLFNVFNFMLHRMQTKVLQKFPKNKKKKGRARLMCRMFSSEGKEAGS